MRARVVVAGTGSGVGKTTATLGMAGALAARGLSVATFKCGPDFLDPTWHALATGRPSLNLDEWMMGEAGVRTSFGNGSAGADVAIVEGMMGLFDGVDPTGEEGSTARIAKILGASVLLVVDASGMARSVAAMAQGYARFDPALRVAGVLANRVGSRGHLDLLRAASAEVPVIGGLPADPAAAFPERHLGLVRAGDAGAAAAVAAWIAAAERWIDLDRVLEIARAAPDAGFAAPAVRRLPRGCRIGLAHDEAFHFYYPENLALLEAAGAELVEFSPIRDARLPGVDALCIGGGYPETWAAALSENRPMMDAIGGFEGPVYAECGGLMLLARRLVTSDGRTHEMAGLLPLECRMTGRIAAIGYAEVATTADTILGPAGTTFRGHQFRTSEASVQGVVERVYSVATRPGAEPFAEGFRAGRVLASYVHAHWASNPSIPEFLVGSIESNS